MSDMELISVVVPVYNSAPFLHKCLESLSAQTYKNIEIILVDDGSTDESGVLCDDFAAMDARCKVIHQSNGGPFSARNAGIEASTGDYLIFPDSDDYFHQDFIRQLYQALVRYPECDFAMCGRKITGNYDEDTAFDVDAKLHILKQPEYVAELFKATDACCVYMWNKLYRREAIRGVRVREYPMSQDWDFNFRFFLRTEKAVLVDKELYFWVQRPGSLTHNERSVQTYFSCRTEMLYRNLRELPKDRSDFSPLLLNSLWRKMVFWRAKAIGFDDVAEVRKRCKAYREATLCEFLTCGKIRLYERLLWPLLIRMPHLTRMILGLTDNI